MQNCKCFTMLCDCEIEKLSFCAPESTIGCIKLEVDALDFEEFLPYTTGLFFKNSSLHYRYLMRRLSSSSSSGFNGQAWQGPRVLPWRLFAFTYQCKTPLNARPNLISRVRIRCSPNPFHTLKCTVALALRGILH